ncbi:MAG: 4-(cytidine 5'-diphospho)-2-C-methyl-D-erythritol kinase [Flavobacteriales bacterium]|nr:4-(cytidine 5'-diphospho)-2-C-methyl-D-erythritol kinase [Flavobacteriales bacterium]
MISFPNCKINLGLRICSKRADGFHNLESAFYPIPLFDSLEFVESTKTTLSIHGTEVDGLPSDNLILRAYDLLKLGFDLPALEIHLLKKIPMGGGLGGGSSNGAHMLTMLNQHFKLGLGFSQLEELSAELGSDCPFFIRNQPTFVTGRGEIMKPISTDLQGLYLVLILSGIHVSTKDAFSGIHTFSPHGEVDSLVADNTPKNWKGYLKNDFENSVFSIHPELDEAKQWLYQNGADYASMTGTGSTIYGIFAKKPNLARLPIKGEIKVVKL